MEYIINKLKSFWWSDSQQNYIEGHILENDTAKNRALVLVKKTSGYWKTEWIDTTNNVINVPSESIINIFKNN
jgi:hypothetical protein